MHMLEFLKHVLSGPEPVRLGRIAAHDRWRRLGHTCARFPARIWYWIVEQTTLSITVKDEDAAFHWVKQWFAEQKFLKRIRRVDLDTTVRNENWL